MMSMRSEFAANTASSSTWNAWTPSDSEPWNAKRVAHLHRRAGFAATWTEIERDLRDGPATAIQRLLDGKAYVSSVPENFEQLDNTIRNSAVGSNNADNLQAWWLFRMLYSPDPLGERLCLLWHQHFATSQYKVRNLRLMAQQNQLFRKLGRGYFDELFTHVLRDPAILIYLDATDNQADHPNENLGREMMELFSMGVGNYTEADVHEAARSLTGWTVKDNQFQFQSDFHDPEEKLVLGNRGNHRGEDLIKIVLDHPATARRITWRICQMLMGENVVDESALNELADQFRDHRMNISWLLEKVLRSKLFFDDANIGTRIRSAAEFVVSSIRCTGAHSPRPATLGLAQWTSRMGQKLFFPPNVFGFPEGRNWISSHWLIARSRFVNQLLEGKLHRQRFSPRTALQSTVGKHQSLDEPDFLATLVLGLDRNRYDEIVDRSGKTLKKILNTLLMSPWAHLG